jgi:hypothetical protein
MGGVKVPVEASAAIFQICQALQAACVIKTTVSTINATRQAMGVGPADVQSMTKCHTKRQTNVSVYLAEGQLLINFSFVFFTSATRTKGSNGLVRL